MELRNGFLPWRLGMEFASVSAMASCSNPTRRVQRAFWPVLAASLWLLGACSEGSPAPDEGSGGENPGDPPASRMPDGQGEDRDRDSVFGESHKPGDTGRPGGDGDGDGVSDRAPVRATEEEDLQAIDELPSVPGDGATDFVSYTADRADGAAPAEPAATGAAAPEMQAADADSNARLGDAARAISEADIIQVHGDLLFALSRYAGMTIVDLTDPGALSVLGQYRTSATPFEMYLEGDTAYVMFNGYYTYVHDEEAGATVWQSTARIQALDVSDPGDITVIADHAVPGNVSDSRKVGDILYLVTFQNGYCYRCDQTASTRVSSFDASSGDSFEPVDELRFDDDNNSYGARSISVTQERMYVAGPSWGRNDVGSTIQVVDISDPTGSLDLGDEVPVAGIIDNRWQMDEYDGYLRVISQSGGFRSQTPPTVETFEIESSDSITPVGSLQMVLPRPEDLQSVRFDGDRAYAITFERTDPFFTLDMSDPARPRQLGELEIPGFVYHMEPRGDRVYGLGFDNMNEDGGMHVSIFDVSDLQTPTMLDRVNFGSQWAHRIEDQDRIHKAFNLMLDEGHIFVPFAGGEYEEGTCRYEYRSGIQLIDIEGDDLTLRGAAPQIGQARRSLLHDGILMGISDDAVQSFDISDRDAPLLLGKLEVARNIESMHVLDDRILRFGRDWWTDRTLVDFTGKDDTTTAQPLGEIDLSELFDNEQDECNQWSSWGNQVLVHGETAYVSRRQSRYNQQYSENLMTIYVLDISDNTPEVVSSVELDPAMGGEWIGNMVLTDSALLVARGEHRYYHYRNVETTIEPKFYYEIFDLSDPRAPEHVQRFEVPGQLARYGWGYGPIGCGLDMGWGWWYPGPNSSDTLVWKNILISQREEPLDDDTGRVRYFLERLDLSDPKNPTLLPSVNIPGKAIHYDGDRDLLVTLEDELRTIESVTYNDCYWRGNRVYFDWSTNGGVIDRNDPGLCKVFDRHLNTLKLSGDVATRVSRVNLDESRLSTRVAVSSARVFATTRERVKPDASATTPPTSTTVMDTFAVGTDLALRVLDPVELPGMQPYYFYGQQLSARERRAFVQSHNQLHIIDTEMTQQPELTTHDMPGWSCRSLQVDDTHAYCAMGKNGVLAFDL